MFAANNEVICAIITTKTKRRVTMNELQTTYGLRLLGPTKILKVAKSCQSLQNQ